MTKDVLPTLEQFRVTHGAPSATAVAPKAGDHAAKPHNGKYARYETAIRAAIERIKEGEMAAVETAGDPLRHRIRFSVNTVVKAAGVGRTQLYTTHKHLVPLIETARQAVERALQERARDQRTTKAGLKQALREERQDHAAALSRLASTQMAELLEALGPMIDEAQRHTVERRRLEEEIAALRRTVERQEEVIAVLMRQLSK